MPTTTYRDFRVVLQRAGFYPARTPILFAHMLQLKQEWAITSGPRARIDHPFDDVVERPHRF